MFQLCARRAQQQNIMLLFAFIRVHLRFLFSFPDGAGGMLKSHIRLWGESGCGIAGKNRVER
jgi:hypothetical protein